MCMGWISLLVECSRIVMLCSNKVYISRMDWSRVWTIQWSLSHLNWLKCQHMISIQGICNNLIRINSPWPSATYMRRDFKCLFPQCPIYGALQTARSSPVPQIVVARPHLSSPQRPIYVAPHGPVSLHVLCGNIKCCHQNIGCSSRLPSSINCSCWNKYTICCNMASFIVNYQTLL